MNTFGDGLMVGVVAGSVLTCAAFITLILLCGWYVRRNRFMYDEGNPKGR